MDMKLYQIVVEGRDPVFVASRTSHRASFVYICAELNADRQLPDFEVVRIDNKLTGEQRVGLDEFLAECSPGIVGFDGLFGWTALPPPE